MSQRTKKGAAVAVAEYLAKKYSDVQGFSPRNLRRMRDFYRTYENQPAMLSLQLGWTQNVVILEADLSIELLEWYHKATSQLGCSKAELKGKIAANAHEMIVLAIDEEVCYIERREKASDQEEPDELPCKENKIRHLIQKVRCRVYPKEEGGRRWSIMSCLIFTESESFSCDVREDPGFSR